MSNKIRFEINTDASYNEAERLDLLDTFADWFAKVDGDVVEGTEDVKIVDANETSNDAERVRDAATELIAKGTVRINFEISDNDGEEIFSTKVELA